MTTKQKTESGSEPAKPDLVARTMEGYGRNARFTTVGVAWTQEDGSIRFRPYGKQIIDGTVYLIKATAEK